MMIALAMDFEISLRSPSPVSAAHIDTRGLFVLGRGGGCPYKAFQSLFSEAQTSSQTF